MEQIQPILLSAVVCDRVIFDRVSGMPSLIDIVHAVNATAYPARHGQIFFFCELTNGHGPAEAEVRIVDTQEDEKVVFEHKGMVEFKDVKQIVTLAVSLQGIVFPHPGEYCFQLHCNEEFLGERRILCRLIKQNPPPTNNAS